MLKVAWIINRNNVTIVLIRGHLIPEKI